MSKGFGEIMAEAYMALHQEVDSPPCPLCGEPLEDNGAAYFCRDAAHQEWLMSRRDEAFKASEAGEVVFYLDLTTPPGRRLENWDPQLQGAVLAVAVSPAGRRIFFSTARGRGGTTTFRVDKDPDGWKPSLDDWVWAGWTGKGDS